MSGPTILRKGNLNAHPQSPTKEVLDEIVPLDYVINWFEPRLLQPGESAADRIMVLRSSTGSGKSTILPPAFFYKYFEKSGRKNIAITQPRVLTASKMPDQIIPYNDAAAFAKRGITDKAPLVLGDNIGFQTGSVKRKPARGMIFMTVGIIQQQMKTLSFDEFAKMYSLIILDEAHQRDIAMDFTMCMLKKMIEENYAKPECPFLIVTSATMNPYRYSDYLLASVPAPKRYENIIDVEGFTFPIEKFYAEPESSYIVAAANTVSYIHKEFARDFLPVEEVYKQIEDTAENANKLKEDIIAEITEAQNYRDILVFVTGGADAKEVVMAVERLNKNDEFFKKYPIFTMTMTSKEVNAKPSYEKFDFDRDWSQLKTADGKTPVRKLIVANVVAETGLTVDTLRYSVDCGYVKTNEFDPTRRVSILLVRPVTVGMYKQRIGRAGRKAPGGKAYLLYPEEFLKTLREDQLPDILQNDNIIEMLGLLVSAADPQQERKSIPIYELFASDYIERIAQTKINIYDFDLMDLPSADSIHSCTDRLFRLGFINENCTPTALGVIAMNFRFLTPESIKLILSAWIWDFSAIDLLNVAVMTTIPFGNLFEDKNGFRSFHRAVQEGKFQLGSNKLSFMLDTSCDFLLALAFWNIFQEACGEHAVKAKIGGKPKKKGPGPKKPQAPKPSRSMFDQKIQDHCVAHGINYSALLGLVELRDELLELLMIMGLNPFHKFENSFRFVNQFNAAEYISGFKQCLFESFKYNIATWSQSRQRYYSNHGKLEFDLKSPWLESAQERELFDDDNPRNILYATLSFNHKMQQNAYPGVANYCSALDGFISF